MAGSGRAGNLLCLLDSLAGEDVTVELRDETCVRGRVDSVDAQGNIHMRAVVYLHRYAGSAPSEFERFVVRGRLVRYVHPPDDFDMLAALQRAAQPPARPSRSGRADPRKERRRQLFAEQDRRADSARKAAPPADAATKRG